MRWALALALGPIACESADPEPEPEPEMVTVTVTLRNPSAPGALGGADILLAPGVWAIGDVFVVGEPASPAFERLAEDGDNAPMVGELVGRDDVSAHGSFGSQAPGENYEENPIGPGDSVEFIVTAQTNEFLSVAAMFIHSNDIVVGGRWRLDQAIAGGAELTLYDAGTEQNEEPGIGPNQPMQSAEPDAGVPEDGVVAEVDDGFTYPAVSTFAVLTIDGS